MNCPKCNASFPEDALFCGVCGFKFNGETVESSSDINTKKSAPLKAEKQVGIIRGSLSDSWQALKSNYFKIYAMLLIYVMLVILIIGPISFISGIFSVVSGTAQILSVVFAIFGMTIYAGLAMSFVKMVRKEETHIAEMFSGFRKIIPIFVVWLVFLVAQAIPFIIVLFTGLPDEAQIQAMFASQPKEILAAAVAVFILIIFAIITISMGFAQTFLLIMDKNCGGIKALITSWKIMRGYKFKFFLLYLNYVALFALSAVTMVILIPLLKGLGFEMSWLVIPPVLLLLVLVVVPWMMVAFSAFYNRLPQPELPQPATQQTATQQTATPTPETSQPEMQQAQQAQLPQANPSQAK